MVLLNIYGKIEPTIISKKLGIGLCNPTPDWEEGLQDDFHEKILIHNQNYLHLSDLVWMFLGLRVDMIYGKSLNN